MSGAKEITGSGVIRCVSLDTNELIKQVGHKKKMGKFIRRYDMSEEIRSIGGSVASTVLFGKDLEGCMLEFENYFFVIWSCNEYIDVAYFKK